MRHFGLTLSCVLACFCGVLRADPQADASQLRDEALAILKANCNKNADPKEMAQCIFSLEKASNLLEAAHDTDSSLATDVASELYWARKRSTLQIDAELDKLHGVTGKAYMAPTHKNETPAPKPAAPAPKPDANESGEMAQAQQEQSRQTSAEKAFRDAQSFAQAHANDDYVVALNYFRAASQNPGTDASMRMITLAQEAQQRFAAKSAPAQQEELPDTPEIKLVRNGDALAAQGNFESAFTMYRSSLQMKPTLVAQRRLAHAYFKRAQQIKDELMPQFAPAWEAYRQAVLNAYTTVQTMSGSIRRFNRNDPEYQRTLAAYKALLRQADVAFDNYNKAQGAFKSVLKLAPKEKDLDAAGHVGLCFSVNPKLRPQAKLWLSDFLKQYEPANDIERSVFEYCRTEYERISK